jgi:hypothetical protein
LQTKIPPDQAKRLFLPQPGYHFKGKSAQSTPGGTPNLRVPTIFDPTVIGRSFELEYPKQDVNDTGDARKRGRPTRTHLLLSNFTILSADSTFATLMDNSSFSAYMDIPPLGQMCISNRCSLRLPGTLSAERAYLPCTQLPQPEKSLLLLLCNTTRIPAFLRK